MLDIRTLALNILQNEVGSWFEYHYGHVGTDRVKNESLFSRTWLLLTMLEQTGFIILATGQGVGEGNYTYKVKILKRPKAVLEDIAKSIDETKKYKEAWFFETKLSILLKS